MTSKQTAPCLPLWFKTGSKVKIKGKNDHAGTWIIEEVHVYSSICDKFRYFALICQNGRHLTAMLEDLHYVK